MSEEVKTLTPTEAYKFLEEHPNAVFIDVRSHMEFLFVGHPVVLICRSGVRSLEAGKVLVEAGVKDVYNVAEGFEGQLDDKHHRSTQGGWRFHGLPWEQC